MPCVSTWNARFCGLCRQHSHHPSVHLLRGRSQLGHQRLGSLSCLLLVCRLFVACLSLVCRLFVACLSLVCRLFVACLSFMHACFEYYCRQSIWNCDQWYGRCGSALFRLRVTFVLLSPLFHQGYGDLTAFGGRAPDPTRMQNQGAAFLRSEFPLIDYFNSCSRLPVAPAMPKKAGGMARPCGSAAPAALPKCSTDFCGSGIGFTGSSYDRCVMCKCCCMVFWMWCFVWLSV